MGSRKGRLSADDADKKVKVIWVYLRMGFVVGYRIETDIHAFIGGLASLTHPTFT
jgi:hypothetical protein